MVITIYLVFSHEDLIQLPLFASVFYYVNGIVTLVL